MLVTVEELQAHMNGLSLSYEQDENFKSVLSATQAELELHINRVFEPVQVREMIRSDLNGILILTYAPVWKVVTLTSLEAYGSHAILTLVNPFIPEPLERDPMLGTKGQMWDTIKSTIAQANLGTIVPGGVDIGVPNATYVVEYVSCYTTPHLPAVKQAIKRVAARQLTTSADDTVSLNGDSRGNAVVLDNRGVGWTEAELSAFDRMRRRVML